MRTIPFALLCVTLVGCDSVTAPDELGDRLTIWIPGPNALLAERGFSGGGPSGNFVVVSEDSWDDCWQLFGVQNIEAPPVDFETEMVFGLIPGWDSALIDSIVEFDRGARVYATSDFIPVALTIEMRVLRMYAVPKVEIVDIRVAERKRH